MAKPLARPARYATAARAQGVCVWEGRYSNRVWSKSEGSGCCCVQLCSCPCKDPEPLSCWCFLLLLHTTPTLSAAGFCSGQQPPWQHPALCHAWAPGWGLGGRGLRLRRASATTRLLQPATPLPSDTLNSSPCCSRSRAAAGLLGEMQPAAPNSDDTPFFGCVKGDY